MTDYHTARQAEEGVSLLTEETHHDEQEQRYRFPLASTSELPREGTSRAKIGVIEGVSIVCGLQIGSGIFASPGVVLRETGSPGTAILILFISGLLSWAGASSFAELGSAISLDGGQGAYLLYAYGEGAQSCFSVAATFVLKPSSAAILSLIGSEYLCRLMYKTAFDTDSDAAVHTVPGLVIKCVAILFVLVTSALQAFSERGGLRSQVVLTAFKVLAICGILVGGCIHLIKVPSSSPFTFDNFAEETPDVANYALAFFTSLWVFDGWDNGAYLSRDLKDGALPKILNISMLTVILLVVGSTISFLSVVPLELASGTSTIGLEFGRQSLGSIGAAVISLIVAISCLGALNSSLYTTSRLIVASSQQGILPVVFSNLSKRSTPVYGILLSAAVTVVFILTGDFTSLALFYGIVAWSFNLAVVIGLIVLRIKHPDLHRPYRTLIITPIIFSSTALFLLIIATFSRPWESLGATFFILASGIPYSHARWQRQRSRENQEKVEMEDFVEEEEEER